MAACFFWCQPFPLLRNDYETPDRIYYWLVAATNFITIFSSVILLMPNNGIKIDEVPWSSKAFFVGASERKTYASDAWTEIDPVRHRKDQNEQSGSTHDCNGDDAGHIVLLLKPLSVRQTTATVYRKPLMQTFSACRSIKFGDPMPLCGLNNDRIVRSRFWLGQWWWDATLRRIKIIEFKSTKYLTIEPKWTVDDLQNRLWTAGQERTCLMIARRLRLDWLMSFFAQMKKVKRVFDTLSQRS